MTEAITAAYKKGLAAGYQAALDGFGDDVLPSLAALYAQGVRDNITGAPFSMSLQ